jgi:hypothetical protein
VKSKTAKTDARYRDYIELGCVVLCCLCPDRSVESSFVFIYYYYYESKTAKNADIAAQNRILILRSDIALY